MNAYFVNIPNEERQNILNKHKEVYNGYRTLNPNPVENEQPLYIQDFANDKGGLVVNNKGEVKPYTNMGINEARNRKPYLAKEEEEELDEYFYFPPNDDGSYGKKDPNRENDLDSALSIFDKLEDEEDKDEYEDELSEGKHMCEQCGLKESLCECNYLEEGDDMYLGIGDYGFYDSKDRQYGGDFDFDYDEEEYDDFDEFIEKYPNQNWFQTKDGRDFDYRGSKKVWDKYKDEFGGPYKLRKRKYMNEEDGGDMYLGIGDYGFYDSKDRQYGGDFDFDYDEEEYDDFDDFVEKYPNQNWFQTKDGRDFDYRGSKKVWDKYKDEFGGPYKLRKRKHMNEEDGGMSSVDELGDALIGSGRLQEILAEENPLDYSDEFEFVDNVIAQLLYPYSDDEYHDELYDYIKDVYGEMLFNYYNSEMGDDDFDEEDVDFGEEDDDEYVTEQSNNILSNELDSPVGRSAYGFMSGGPEQFSDDEGEPHDGYEDDIEKIQNMFDYQSQHDADPDAKNMIKNLNKQMNYDFDGDEPSDGEKEAYNFISGGPPGVTFNEEEELDEEEVEEKWSEKYKKSIDCNNPKGFSQKAHCQGRKKHEEKSVEEEVDEDLRESFTQQKNKITEMFQRFNRYN